MTEVLRGEDGGSIDGYIARFKLLENTHIIIDGDCNSACTMVLGNRDVCSTERGRLNFHHASNGDTGRPSPAGTAQLMARYPLNVREWIESQGGLTAKWISAPARMFLPSCSDADDKSLNLR